MSNEYTRPFYEIVCGLNNYKLGTIIENETGQRYKLTKIDNEYRKFSRIDKGLRFLTYENMNKKFRIVEEQEEIDIQDIEKLDKNLKFNDLKPPYGINEEMMWAEIIKQHNKSNELVQAVKYLENKLKEKQ